jgi:hypothetical protein
MAHSTVVGMAIAQALCLQIHTDMVAQERHMAIAQEHQMVMNEGEEMHSLYVGWN